MSHIKGSFKWDFTSFLFNLKSNHLQTYVNSNCVLALSTTNFSIFKTFSFDVSLKCFHFIQVSEDRLFDRGEANTNFETLLFGKAILEELLALADVKPIGQTSVQDTSDHKGVQPATDDLHQSTSRTSCLADIDSDRSHLSMGWLLSKKSQGLHWGSGQSGVHPKQLEYITLASKQDLVTAAQEIIGKILHALEQFLDNMSDISLATPYLETTEYETMCVRCWGLLAAIQGLGCLVRSQFVEQCLDDTRMKMLQLMQLVVAKFGGEQHCNLLIRKTVDDIKQL